MADLSLEIRKIYTSSNPIKWIQTLNKIIYLTLLLPSASYISINRKKIEKKPRAKSGKFGHEVNSDTRLQTLEIQMRRLLMSRLIRIFHRLLSLFFIPITEL